MLGYRKTPAGPRRLRPGMICAARAWSPLADGRDRPAAALVAGPVAAAGPRRSGPGATADPGQFRDCLIGPKSSVDHFAAKALLALI